MTPDPIHAPAHTCTTPGCRHVWYRPDVGTPVPDCPAHHTALEKETTR